MSTLREPTDLRVLIRFAAAGDDAVAEAISRLGPARVAATLVDELVSRADLGEVGPLPGPVTVRFDLDFGGRTLAHSVSFEEGRVRYGHACPEGIRPVLVELDLVALARAVFGGSLAPHALCRRIDWGDVDDPREFAVGVAAAPVVQRLLRGAAGEPARLDELALANGSDKWGPHFYTPIYERHFAPLREQELTIVELGIGGYAIPGSGGGSLRMWKRHFPRALVYGVDMFDKSAAAEQRVFPIQGDLSDPDFVGSLPERLGPLDIVIDDGSHACADVILAFNALFPALRPGGLYVIEDLQTSYWPSYGGNATNLHDASTSMGFLKQLLDGLNHEEHDAAGSSRPTRFDTTLVGAHFYHNVAVLEKGRNADGPMPRFVRQRPVIRVDRREVPA
ncbi:class I SAM-dependent methyltransferase [Micromonospora foliorum]|uniref:class I SAM-dependent methyltransferase n=1 Tax=Micromonospora foliorum TaxID=2911210 RepID=UPI001EE973EB|nr:class I SAM-dependent methyltransferase [Micromonospora foliorum]MCG5435258.1 hypothetical protein [Micromonospora foliorum]